MKQEVDQLSGSQTCTRSETAIMVAVIALVCAATNAPAIVNWLNGFPVHPFVESSISLAEQWQTATAELHIPFESVREAIEAFKEYRR